MKTAISVPHKPFNDYMHASLWDVKGDRYEGCWITVSSAGEALTGADLNFAVAHEVFHCFQYDVESFAMYQSAPAWVHEGQASWAGLEVAGDAPVMSDEGNPSNLDHWRGWLQQPEKPLWARAYDAVGFYALLKDAGVAVWGALTPMLTSGGGAYGAAVGAAGDQVAKIWASSLFRDEGPSGAWKLNGKGMTSKGTAPPPIRTIGISNGQSAGTDAVDPLSARLYQLDAGNSDVVVVQVSDGYSRLADAGSLDQASGPASTVNLCTRSGGCDCPDGTEAQSPITASATPPLRWAVGGGGAPASGTARGISLDDWCKKKATPTPAATAAPTASGLLGLCRVFTADDARLLRPDVGSTPVEAEWSRGNGNCFYTGNPNSEGVVASFFITRPTVALAAGDYPLGYQCTTELSGVGDRAAVGTAPDGSALGCLLKGRTVVIINTNGGAGAMPEVLRRIAARL